MSKTFSFDELFEKTEEDDEETISKETYYVEGIELNEETLNKEKLELYLGVKEGENVIAVSDDDENDEKEKILTFNNKGVEINIRKNLHANTEYDIIIYVYYTSGVEKIITSSKTLQFTEEPPRRRGGKKKTQKRSGKTKTRKYNRNHKRDKSKRINIK